MEELQAEQHKAGVLFELLPGAMGNRAACHRITSWISPISVLRLEQSSVPASRIETSSRMIAVGNAQHRIRCGRPLHHLLSSDFFLSRPPGAGIDAAVAIVNPRSYPIQAGRCQPQALRRGVDRVWSWRSKHKTTLYSLWGFPVRPYCML